MSISTLEQLSGIPIHTIRMWERRYRVLSPIRSSGNTRTYTDLDLKRLLDVVSLNQAGLKISKACSLSPAEIDHYLVNDIKKTLSLHPNYEFAIAQLIKFGISYNEFEMSKLLNSCIQGFGMSVTYQEIILPLLQRVGLMWRRSNICPAQEHFIAGLIRQKLMAAIDQVPLATQHQSTWLLFLPEDEGHDIPLLFASFLLRSQGYKVIYLSGQVPQSSLQEVFEQNQVHSALFFMIRQRPVKEGNAYLSFLTEKFPTTPFYLAGNTQLIQSLAIPKNMNVFTTINEFQLLIENLPHAS